jgi:hypothetical protein
MPGPAPKDPAQRRRRHSTGAQKTLLPAKGRSTKSAPRWPLTAAKPSLWASLWRTPQAVVWEQSGMIRLVARYAILLEAAEQPGAQITLLGEVRQLEDRLGLNPKAMRSLLWEIAPDEVAEKRAETPRSKADEMRAELRIVG